MKHIGIDARMLGKKQATGIGNYIEQVITRILNLDNNNKYTIFLKPENYNDLVITHDRATKVKTDCHWYSYCEQVTFLKELNSYNFDLVHFPQFNIPIRYKKPFVITIHDLTAKRFPGHKMSAWYRRKGFNLVFKTAIKKSQKIITVSNYTKNQILAEYNINSEKIVITPLGVENDFLSEVKYGKIESVKRAFNITKAYIFYVGVWRNHKNIVGLLKAFNEIKKGYKLDIQLVLGGKEDPNYPEVRQTWESFHPDISKDIIRPGFISAKDLPILYQGAQAYIAPSFEEGFGLNGLEAMASKTPVICSNTASLPEIYGDAAEYFDPHDPKDMAKKISNVLSSSALQRDLIAKGLKQYKKYNWDKTTEQTLAIYESLLYQNK